MVDLDNVRLVSTPTCVPLEGCHCTPHYVPGGPVLALDSLERVMRWSRRGSDNESRHLFRAVGYLQLLEP